MMKHLQEKPGKELCTTNNIFHDLQLHLVLFNYLKSNLITKYNTMTDILIFIVNNYFDISIFLNAIPLFLVQLNKFK